MLRSQSVRDHHKDSMKTIGQSATVKYRLTGRLIWALLIAGFTGTKLFSSSTNVASIADLRNTNPSFVSVEVLDYYPLKSGTYPDRGRGGGTFRWISDVPLAAEDGGRYIRHATITTGMWERVLQGQIPNVKMWGARGDGMTDDTRAIQAALVGIRGSPHWAQRGRAPANVLIFPSGIYRITDTIVIFSGAHIRGEGSLNSTTIVMSPEYTDRDIFRTKDADIYLKGSTAIDEGTSMYTNNLGRVNFAMAMKIEDISLNFGERRSDQLRGGQTGAAICLALPGETSIIQNVHFFGGGYGVRVIGGGTPGIKIDNCGFFYQCIASISVEGFRYRLTPDGTDRITGYTGPITLTSVAGDSFSQAQIPNNCFLLFTNCTPSVSITDMSLEGAYGMGAIRCSLQPNAVNPFGYIAVRNGTYNGTTRASVQKDFLVLENPHSSSTRMPDVSIEGFAMYGVQNVIADQWQARFIPATRSFNNQLPVRRPMHYASTITAGEKRSLLVYGDTAYFSFIPKRTGWKRVLRTFGADAIMGGRLAINSKMESSEFSFNMAPQSNEISVTRRSKYIGANWNPCVTQVRGYTFFKDRAYHQAIDIYVNSMISTSHIPEQQAITLTLPLEGRTEVTSGMSYLITPLDLETNANNAIPNPGLPDEKYSGVVGPFSLLR